MGSPFPGMDPYVEGQAWTDFHHRFIADAASTLAPALLPRYLLEVDLLRGGPRLPIRGAVPMTDFVGVVSRAGERPDAAWAQEVLRSQA